MKKTLIASAIALTSIVSSSVNANLSVTSMDFGNNYAAAGFINDDGTPPGTFYSIDNFFYQPWIAYQATAVITNSNGVTWDSSTTSLFEAWDFAADIANMTNDQIAVGVLFNWASSSQEIAVLAVFDCISTPGVCTGQAIGADGNQFGGMQNGPFVGSVPTFNGSGNLTAVPVPSAVLLMSSGLFGLLAIARRRHNQSNTT